MGTGVPLSDEFDMPLFHGLSAFPITPADERGRVERYQEWERRWTELVPSLPLFQHTLLYALEDSVQPAGLEPTGLVYAPSGLWDQIGAWQVAAR